MEAAVNIPLADRGRGVTERKKKNVVPELNSICQQ
jgi:hypothetical protein